MRRLSMLPQGSRTRLGVRLSLAFMAAVAALLVPGGGSTHSPLSTQQAAASTPTIVTLGFDDGTVDQFANGYPILSAHHMHATFFVNTGPIVAGDPAHMTWADLGVLQSAGDEITGHTVDHADLKPLSVADAEHEVCDDRNALIAHGFAAESFAYPFGSFDSQSEAVVHYCGYDSGRGVAGISLKGPYGETVPPADFYGTRTPPNPKKATKLSTLENYVLNAEADNQSTDWVQYVFHRVCDRGTGGHCGAYSISLAKLTAFLDFLRAERRAGRIVIETTAQVIGGPANPACQWNTGGAGCIPPTP
jgi:peptidoglycan/xylan/chitin deacetylase (PgdA/CDA1 family)